MISRWAVVPALVLLLSSHEGLYAQATEPVQAPFNWLTVPEALTAASVSGRPILIDVYAPWCPWCSKIQSDVYPVPEIQSYLEKNFEISRLNIDDTESTVEFKGYTLTSAELASGLGAQATPTTVFLTAKGDYITRAPGYVEADDFILILKYIGSGAFESESFQEYKVRN